MSTPDPIDHGTAWHPTDPSKYDDGLLPDLTDDEVDEHLAKPEAADQIDAGRSLGHDGTED